MVLALFGTTRRRQRSSEEADAQLIRVLDRRVDVPALRALNDAIRSAPAERSLHESAICLDSSAFLRLGGHAKADDIIDFLRTKHSPPIILPGQSIQEFWNNQLQAVQTVSSGLRKKFDDLRNEFTKVDPNFGDYGLRLVGVLDEFRTDHGYIYDESTVRKTSALFQMLQDVAIISFVSRSKFADLASQRKRTKTPPGFHDVGDGDFYIWLDLLRGLQIARAKRRAFARVVLVTEDQKPDWTRGGVPHPLLTAEMHSLFGVPLEIWRLPTLAQEIMDALKA